MNLKITCCLWCCLIPPCLAQDFEVTVDRPPDFRARWPEPTNQTYRVRNVGPGSNSGCYQPSGQYSGGGVFYNIEPVPYYNPHLRSVQPGIVLNTPTSVRIARKEAQRNQLNAVLEQYARENPEPKKRRR